MYVFITFEMYINIYAGSVHMLCIYRYVCICMYDALKILSMWEYIHGFSLP